MREREAERDAKRARQTARGVVGLGAATAVPRLLCLRAAPPSRATGTCSASVAAHSLCCRRCAALCRAGLQVLKEEFGMGVMGHRLRLIEELNKLFG